MSWGADWPVSHGKRDKRPFIQGGRIRRQSPQMRTFRLRLSCVYVDCETLKSFRPHHKHAISLIGRSGVLAILNAEALPLENGLSVGSVKRGDA